MKTCCAGDLMRLEGMYAVMKFRTFTLTEENQRMRMALSAYQQEHPALVRLVEQLRMELEESKRSRPMEPSRADERVTALASSPPKPSTGILQALSSRLSHP